MPKVVFILTDDSRKEVEVPVGENLLEAAHQNNIPLEGACEGSLACSTCHVIVEQKWFTKLEEPSEQEEDLLDLAFGLKRTSRLGCQIIMSDELDGIEVYVPEKTRNLISGSHH
ncbi:MAG: ferredoxin family 2Fe-2S iron-sulfur cluster binding protein [Alphaproteobacteria bacterium]